MKKTDIKEKNVRLEKDSMGEIKVPANQLWGAQTQRSLTHFDISQEKMPQELLNALAQTKLATAKIDR
ncbi:MAG: fumarate hydratase, partial [Candidatus Regiella insecticola]|nr:fumarate hydratase [Candidatus Regiella insecticola]